MLKIGHEPIILGKNEKQNNANFLGLELKDGCINIGEAQLSIAHSPKMQQLFSSFLESTDLKVSVSEIVEILEGKDLKKYSNQFLKSKHHNAVKLISRARNYCHEAFDPFLGTSVRWFSYSMPEQNWTLYQYSYEYLSNQLYWQKCLN